MIKHYRKNKRQKKITLFSNDAIPTFDETGIRYNKYTWNNLNMNFSNNFSKMTISSLDFKTFYEPLQTNIVVKYDFENIITWANDGVIQRDFQDLSTNGYDALIDGNLDIERNVVQNGVGSVRFNRTLGDGLYIDQNSDKLYNHLHQNLDGMTIGFWYRPVTGGNQGNLGRIFAGSFGTDQANMIQFYHNTSTTAVMFGCSRAGVYQTVATTVTLNTWQHFIWVIDPLTLTFGNAEHNWKIYKNGVLIHNTSNKFYPIFSPNYTFTLGKWSLGVDAQGNERECDGYLDDFFILDRAITAGEVSNINNSLFPEPIFTIRSDDVKDIENTDNSRPVVFHNRGYISSRRKKHNSFKFYSPLNQLSFYMSKYIDSAFTQLGFETRDSFVITLILEDDDDKDKVETNIIEAYSHIPQMKIIY